nr:hypothetical protein ZK507.5 - Caenorhabditis elegans [Caenorhabditis elegans]
MADAFVSRKFQFSDSLNDFPIPEYANYGNYHDLHFEKEKRKNDGESNYEMRSWNKYKTMSAVRKLRLGTKRNHRS